MIVRNSGLCLTMLLLLISCSGKFYTTPNVGPVFVQVNAFGSDEGEVYVGGEKIGRINSRGEIYGNENRIFGESKHRLITQGNIKIRIHLNSSEQGGLYTPDSVKVGTIDRHGKVHDVKGKKIGKRTASSKEILEYYEKEGYPNDHTNPYY